MYYVYGVVIERKLSDYMGNYLQRVFIGMLSDFFQTDDFQTIKHSVLFIIC